MTATESPWSNGLVERHNGVLGNIVRKMMRGKPNCSLETSCLVYGSQELSEECVWILSEFLEKNPITLMFSWTNYQSWKVSHEVKYLLKTSPRCIMPDKPLSNHNLMKGWDKLFGFKFGQVLRQTMLLGLGIKGIWKDLWKGPATVVEQVN